MQKRVKRMVSILAWVSGLGLLVAACGTSTSGTAGPSGNAGTSQGNAGAAYSATMTKLHTESPASFEGPTTPAKAPSGIKIAAISCSSTLEGCLSPTNGIADAANAINWQERTFDGGGTPTQQNTQILNAIAWGANVIALLAIDPKAVQAGMQAAQRSGVLVVSGSSALSPPNPTVNPPPGDLWPAFDVMVNAPEVGKRLADWMVADSQGKANVVIYHDKEFPSNIAEIEGLLPELNKCKGCTVQPIQYFTGTQVPTTLGPETVSYLRNHPDVNYVYVTYDPAATAQVPAIVNAGLANKVKLVSILGDSQNLDYIKSGLVQAADGAYDNEYMGWSLVDQTIRQLDHMPLSLPIGQNEPFVVLDKTNLPSSLKTWTASYDYRSEFLKLWR